MAGYSNNPLAKKLGLKPGMHIRLLHAPDDYLQVTGAAGLGLLVDRDDRLPSAFIHYFVRDVAEPALLLPTLRRCIIPDGMIWVSWVKKSVKDHHIITEDRIREIALASGLVDVKVCAYDESWSALKLVIRLKDR